MNIAVERTSVRRLYCGRSFCEALLASGALDARLLVASAGFGLVANDAELPSYSVTIVPGSEDYILSRTDGGAKDWWRAISARSAHAVPLAPDSTDLFLVAVSRAYLFVLQDELTRWSPENREKLRLFIRISPTEVDAALRPYLMPYDARFDHPDGPNPGTLSDFAQRAARHFAESILPKLTDGRSDQHARLVNQYLSEFRPIDLPKRTRATDHEVMAFIHRHWIAAQGQSSRMLRVLRDDLGVACEQKRFQELFKQVRQAKQEA